MQPANLNAKAEAAGKIDVKPAPSGRTASPKGNIIAGLLIIGLLGARCWLSLRIFDTTPPPQVTIPAGNILPPTGDIDTWSEDSFGTNAWGNLRREGNVLVARCAEADGVNYHYEIYQAGVTLEEGKEYTVQFSARADRPLPITILATLDQGDWRYVGLNQHVQLGMEWKVYRYTFVAHDTVKAHILAPRFALGQAPGTVWLADVFLAQEPTP